MAIMRDQRGSNLNAAQQGLPSVQQAQTPFSLAGRDTTVRNQSAPALQILMDTASKIAGRVTEQSNEEEYLKGANAAATGEAVEDLDSNWLTAQFQKAGYADQTKKLQVANTASEISANMSQYAKMTPQEFAGVIAEKTKPIYEDTDGMTLRGRKDLLEGQVTFSNTLIRTQAAQHGKYIIQQKAAAFNADGNTMSTLMAQAKSTGDSKAYEQATAGMYAWAQRVQNSDLPLDIKNKQVVSMMSNLLSQDMRLPVENFLKSGLANSLPADDLATLNNQVRESKNRTILEDNGNVIDSYSYMTARINSGENVSVDEFNTNLGAYAKATNMSASAFASAQENFFTQLRKNKKPAEIASAYAQGNLTGLGKNNASEQDGADALRKQLYASGMTTAQVAQRFLSIGSQTGFTTAYKQVGNMITPSLSNFGTTQQMNPDAAEILTSTVSNVLTAEANGDKTARFKLMSGLSDEDQEKLGFIAEQVKAGKTVAQAGELYQQQRLLNEGLTPSQRSQRTSQRQSDINEIVGNAGSQGFFTRLGRHVTGIFSDESANKLRTQAASGSITEGAELAELQGALAEEAKAITYRNPYISKDNLEAQAYAAVANRTTRVGETATSPGSVLIAPRGQTIATALGLQPNVTPDRVGKAISGMAEAQPPKGFTASYSFSTDGNIAVQFMDADGNVAPQLRYITKDAVATRVREDDRAAATANNEAYGEGRLFVDPSSNVGVRVNGVNTGGIDEQQMLEFRGKLIGFEGIRDKEYRDSKGVTTNGIGISNLSPTYAAARAGAGEGGTRWSPRVIHDTFVEHTNQLVRRLPSTMTNLGWSTDNAHQFQFAAQLAYQGGDNWYNRGGAYGELADAIRVGDREKAVAALQKTNAYQAAQDSRKEYYTEQLIQGMAE